MLKFCFKCNKAHRPEDMVPKFNSKGRRVGSECRLCANRQSSSFINELNKPKVESKKKVTAD